MIAPYRIIGDDKKPEDLKPSSNELLLDAVIYVFKKIKKYLCICF